MSKYCLGYLAAILVGLSAAVPVRAEAGLKLPRENVTLVAPPFVHAHEQVAKSGPKIIAFKMTVVEKPIVIDEAGTTISGLYLQRFDSRTPYGRAGLVCLNSRLGTAKWISAMVMPQPRLAAAQ
jgi:hypothetical protein